MLVAQIEAQDAQEREHQEQALPLVLPGVRKKQKSKKKCKNNSATAATTLSYCSPFTLYLSFPYLLSWLSLNFFYVWFQFSWTARCGHRTRGTIASRIIRFSCTQICFIPSHYILGCLTCVATMKWITFRTLPEPWPCNFSKHITVSIFIYL